MCGCGSVDLRNPGCYAKSQVLPILHLRHWEESFTVDPEKNVIGAANAMVSIEAVRGGKASGGCELPSIKRFYITLFPRLN